MESVIAAGLSKDGNIKNTSPGGIAGTGTLPSNNNGDGSKKPKKKLKQTKTEIPTKSMAQGKPPPSNIRSLDDNHDLGNVGGGSSLHGIQNEKKKRKRSYDGGDDATMDSDNDDDDASEPILASVDDDDDDIDDYPIGNGQEAILAMDDDDGEATEDEDSDDDSDDDDDDDGDNDDEDDGDGDNDDEDDGDDVDSKSISLSIGSKGSKGLSSDLPLSASTPAVPVEVGKDDPKRARKSEGDSGKGQVPTSKKSGVSPVQKKKVKKSSEKATKKSKKNEEKKKKKKKHRSKVKTEKKKKKKMNEKKQKVSENDVNEDDGANDPYDDTFTAMFAANNTGLVKATPAFYFFLGENRLKIERQLARKHRYFNRLPKGGERNQLIAQEGAMWWVKLRDSEIRRFVAMSMRDFEQRIIEWKEEKSIREMTTESDVADGHEFVNQSDRHESRKDDDILTYENHQRLYLGTTVGSKPFKPDSDESSNRVLLEFLQDMRFHPLPMVQINRQTEEYGEMDFDRVTIPYFDVHGPVSTSLGDECLGCARGWTHFCNVIKRRIPAVEHRAKLQPPLSSLVATRVGLGFQPIPPEEPQPETDKAVKSVALFSTRELPEIKAAKNLPILLSDTLSSPSLRADDIVQFVEEAIYMKVPEPPRPTQPDELLMQESKNSSVLSRSSIPIKAKKQPAEETEADDIDGEYTVNKCGRCRTIIQSDTGCVQCRRAQLVINMSKRGGREGPAPVAAASISSRQEANASKFLRVQTNMLGRVVMRENTSEIQTEGDEAVANHILRQRWTPFTVMPAQALQSPMPRALVESDNDNDDTSDDADDDEAKEESSNENETSTEQPSTTDIEGDPIDIEGTGSKSNDMEVDNGIDGHADGEIDAHKVSELDMQERPSSKQVRTSARIFALGTTNNQGAKVNVAEHLDDQDRQLLAQRFKEEADDLHKKCLSVACFGILLGLTRRDPLLLFAEPVQAEGYHEIVRNPIDFGKIRSNALGGKYSTLGSFVSDCRLLCNNALVFNPPGSIYYKTAKDLSDVLTTMQKRAAKWINAIKDAHASYWRRDPKARLAVRGEDGKPDVGFDAEDPFKDLRREWPDALEMLENSEWLRKSVESDFMRTRENEAAYYGSLAVRRAAFAAALSLAPYPDSSGMYNPVGRRTCVEDESLRNRIAQKVAETANPPELKDIPTWREEMIMRVLRKAQARRMEGMIGSTNGCARCDGMRLDQELKMAMNADSSRLGRSRKKQNEVPRIHKSRLHLSTGLGSKNIQDAIESRREVGNYKDGAKRKTKALIAAANKAKDVAVTVRGSRIHGMGLFADQPFWKGDVVAEYIGEYVTPAVTDARERMYQEHRIQDYQFRLDANFVIDATMRGGHGRYINHNCDPNCIAKIIPGEAGNHHLKRVIIIAQRDIEPLEELSYDYQFPLELDLEARIPCNCHSELCRGFMNWDLPEKGANNQVFRTHKRGANMRDRIRRLGRPLKGEK